ncbi:hypothetical protein BC938DRAFT_471022 [Jimgerdemannia flammicorona]|uniref:SHSP domain-containing protein n=1 Tax=Jimgerdemannia flammicorona TaxID=994334 RepID=A0A433Q922_9FUNG|nr:hypothetical protein BC938DRAFT_471022 [Jimgerdemannia flammicorona]
MTDLCKPFPFCGRPTHSVYIAGDIAKTTHDIVEVWLRAQTALQFLHISKSVRNSYGHVHFLSEADARIFYRTMCGKVLQGPRRGQAVKYPGANAAMGEVTTSGTSTPNVETDIAAATEVATADPSMTNGKTDVAAARGVAAAGLSKTNVETEMAAAREVAAAGLSATNVETEMAAAREVAAAGPSSTNGEAAATTGRSSVKRPIEIANLSQIGSRIFDVGDIFTVIVCTPGVTSDEEIIIAVEDGNILCLSGEINTSGFGDDISGDLIMDNIPNTFEHRVVLPTNIDSECTIGVDVVHGLTKVIVKKMKRHTHKILKRSSSKKNDRK